MKKTRFTALILVIALLAAALTACAKTPEDMRKKADKKLTDKDYEVDVEVDFVCDNVTLDEIFKQLEKTETTVRVSDGKIYAKSDVMINYGDGNTSFTDEYTVIGNMMYLKMAYSEDGGVSKESRIKGEISNDDKDSFKNRIFFIGGIKADDFATVSETVNDDTLVTVYKDETEAARIVLENALLSMLENTASSVSARNVVMTVEIEDGAYETVEIKCDYTVVIQGISIAVSAVFELEFDFDERFSIKAPTGDYADADMSEYVK